MVIAAAAHRQLEAGEPIELINVCFDEAHESPDRLAALRGWLELRVRNGVGLAVVGP
jgi:hypothetical protein